MEAAHRLRENPYGCSVIEVTDKCIYVFLYYRLHCNGDTYAEPEQYGHSLKWLISSACRNFFPFSGQIMQTSFL
jgi:hypothetical protein